MKPIKIFFGRWGSNFHCDHTEKVRELIFQKYFKILPVSKSQYLKRQGGHSLYSTRLSFSVVSGEMRITETKSTCDVSFDW